MAEVLSALWEQPWPTPAGDLQMRFAYPDRWVRFHSLPRSKRYPDREDEYSVLLDRHHTLLNALGPNDTELYVVTCEWNGDSEPTVRMPQLQNVDPDAQYWDTGTAMSTTMISLTTSSTSTNTSALAHGAGRLWIPFCGWSPMM